jgi:translocation and assembly module TamB
MMRRLGRVVIVLGVLAILVVVVIWGALNTEFGRERIRRELVSLLAGTTHGIVSVGELHGDLLSSATLVRFSITDSAGHPFFKADSITGHYVLRSFFAKRLEFSDVVVYRPDVLATRPPPDGVWNYRVLWPASPAKAPGDTVSSWGSWVSLRKTTIVDGHVVVKSPWSPKEGVTKHVRDSIVTAALDSGSRLDIIAVPGGYQKVVTLEHVNASVPFVRWTDPAYKTKLFQVSDANMKAFAFRPPAADVRALAGTFTMDDDSLWWKGASGRLPQTSFKGDGMYNLSSGDMQLTLAAMPASFNDFHWLYKNFPTEGGGNLGLLVQWKGATQDYIVRDADLRSGSAHITGDVGVTLLDTVFFHDANIKVSGLTTKQIEALVPGMKSPRNGVLAGRAKFSGTPGWMKLDTDMTFDAYGRGTNRVVAEGEVGFTSTKPVVVSARNLHVRLAPLQIDIVKLLFPTLPIGGSLSGVATLNGSGAKQLNATGLDIVHTDGANVSHAVGSASVHTIGRQTLDVDVVAQPLALAELTKFAPSLPLKGLATGPVHAHGPIDSSFVDTQLLLPGGGQFALRGPVDFLSLELGYDVDASVAALDLSTVMIGGPVTSLTGGGHAAGRGFKPATMVSDLSMTLVHSSVDTIGVDTIAVRARLADGIANVDTAHVRGSGALVDVRGQLGLDSLHTGTLEYHAAIDSLVQFARFIPGAAEPDTIVIRPRPLRAAEAMLRARADSARLSRQTEIARMVAGAPPVTLKVPDTLRAITKGLIAGSLKADGTIAGSVTRFSLDGTASGTGLTLMGYTARHLATTYKWTDAPSKSGAIGAKLRADSVIAYGFAFDSLAGDLGYTAPNGTLSLRVRQGARRDYALNGDFTLDTVRNELRLADVALRFDSTTWKSTHQSAIRFGASGVEVANLELSSGNGRRIYANGLLPTKGEANFDLQVTNFAVENIAELLQSDLPVTGRLSLDAHVAGTGDNPSINGKADFVQGTYNAVRVPDLHTTLDYANKQLTTKSTVIDSTGRTVASIDGTIPIDLALSGVTGSRLLDLPLDVSLKSDSLPITLIPQFTAAITDVGGRVYGDFSATGTLKKPVLHGNVVLQDAQFKVAATGTFLQHVNGAIHMTGDTIQVDSIAGSANGPIRVSGNIAVGNWSDPSFQLALNATDAQLMNNATGEVHADAALSLSGPLSAPRVTGDMTVLHGVLYIPESSGKKVIGADDPSLFSVVDTSVAMQRDLFPAQSPMFKNLHVDVAFSVERNTWVRSRDANVEIFTDGAMNLNVVGDALTLTGAVDADRGEYTFLSKRFQIKRGSAIFIGTPDLNPTLQITAEYQVKGQPGATATNIRVLIGGTLTTPKISLESDAQPPLSQSDLLSYLAFGERSTSLLQFDQTSLGGGNGNLLSVAGTRLAGIAVGVALDEIKGNAARSLGVDVFNITPGDIPVFSGQSGFDTFIKNTEVEVGRYLDPQTFVSLIATPGAFACTRGGGGTNSSCAPPGLTLTHRTAKGLRFDTSYAPRYFLNPPTLAGQTVAGGGQFGAFVIREWRF